MTLHSAREQSSISITRADGNIAVEVLVDNHLLTAIVSVVAEFILRLLPQGGRQLIRIGAVCGLAALFVG